MNSDCFIILVVPMIDTGLILFDRVGIDCCRQCRKLLVLGLFPNLQTSDWCLLGFKMFVMTFWGDLGLVLVSVCNTICTEHDFDYDNLTKIIFWPLVSST